MVTKLHMANIFLTHSGFQTCDYAGEGAKSGKHFIDSQY